MKYGQDILPGPGTGSWEVHDELNTRKGHTEWWECCAFVGVTFKGKRASVWQILQHLLQKKTPPTVFSNLKEAIPKQQMGKRSEYRRSIPAQSTVHRASVFMPAEDRLWWDTKLLGSFAVVGKNGKTAQPGSCGSSVEKPRAGLGKGAGHSLSRLPLDFRGKHPQRATTFSSWATTGEWPDPGSA